MIGVDRRWARLRVTALALLAGGAIGASEQANPLYRSNTRTVPIFATVVDSRGRLVPGLRADAFSVIDDGKVAPLSVFSNDPQPFTAVVMLDTSASMTANLDLLKRAAEQFFSALSAGDRAQVGAFNDRIQLNGTFTNESSILISALGQLDVGNPTRLYDAIDASVDALKSVDGRRIVLVFTDGDDTASRTVFKSVLARALDEEVMVYAIGLEAEYFNGTRLVKTRPTPGSEAARRGNRRRIFRTGQDRRSCADVHASHRRAAEPVPAWVRACRLGRQDPHPERPRRAPRHDGPLAAELPRDTTSRVGRRCARVDGSHACTTPPTQ